MADQSQTEPAPTPPSRPGRRIGLVVLAVGLALIVLAGAGTALIRYRPQTFIPLLEKTLAPRGGRLRVTDLRVRFRPLSLTVAGVRLTVPGSTSEPVELDRLTARLDAGAWLAGRPWLKELEVIRPRLALTVPSGATGEDKRSMDLSALAAVLGAERLVVRRGRINLERAGMGLTVDGLELTLAAGKSGGPLPLTLAAKVAIRLGDGQTIEAGLTGRGALSLDQTLGLDLELTDGRGRLAGRAGRFSGRGRLSLSLDRLSLAQAELKFNLDRPSLSGRVSGDVALTLADGRLSLTALKVSLPGLVELTGNLERSAGATSAGLTGRVERVAPVLGLVSAWTGPLPAPVTKLAAAWPEPIDLALTGRLTAAGRAELDNLAIDAGPATITADRFVYRPGPGWQGGLKIKVADTSEVWPRIKPWLPAAIREVKPSGPLNLTLDWGGEEPDRGRLTADPTGLRLELDQPAVKVGLTGPVNLDLSPAGVTRLRGKVNVSGRAEAGAVGLTGFRLDLEPDYRPGRGGTAAWRIAWPDKGLTWRGEALPLGRVEASGRAEVKADNQIELSQLVIDSSQLGRLIGRAAWTEQGPSAELAGEKFDLARLAQSAARWLPVDPAAWGLTGRTDLKLTYGGDGGRVEAHFSGLGLASPDSRLAVQGLGGSTRLGFGRTDRPALSLALDLTTGEALYDTIYLNLAQRPLKLTAGAEKIGSTGLEGVTLDLAAGKFGRYRLSGRGQKGQAGWVFAGRVKAEAVDLKDVYATFISQPLSALRPDLARLEPGGRAEADLTIDSRPGRTAVTGRVGLTDASLIDRTAKQSLAGVGLDLPVDYVWTDRPVKARPPTAKDWGRLTIARAQSPFGELTDFTLPLALVPNRLVVGRNLELPLFGSRLIITEPMVDRPLSGDFKVRARVKAERFDLAALPLSRFKLTGELSGDLGRVELDRQRLLTEGKLTGRLFGGALEVDSIEVYRPLEPGRVIGADVIVNRLHLDELTKMLGVGLITGRMDARIERLQLARFQPIGFNLTARSVEVAKVSQKVSLRAVNSISVLGTGAGLTGLGVKLFKPFFEEFPYQAIGFGCNLRNDVFTVRGLIVEDGVEYLVRKPMLTGINVVNRNPDNRIGFSDMVDRLTRVLNQESIP